MPMNMIDLSILTRKQATMALHENLDRKIIFSGLRHKNYHVRLLALRTIGIKNRFKISVLQKDLRQKELSHFRFQLLIEEEMYANC